MTKVSFGQNGGWWAPPEARGAYYWVSGEGVVVKVGDGRYLFATLRHMPNLFSIFFPGESPLKVAAQMGTLRQDAVLTTDQYPLLVTYGDIADPMTVKAVGGANASVVLGPGFTIKSVTLSITDDAITSGSIAATGIRFVTKDKVEKAFADHSYDNSKLAWQLSRNDFSAR